MPTGSFIGVGNFKGLWNATTNSGSNSDLAPPLADLLANSASVGAGYGLATGLTASVGDYWQVFVAGSTSIDGETAWALNDWVVYQSSSATGKTWNRLSVTDTIAATVIGNISESGLKNTLLASASVDSQPQRVAGDILFCTSSLGSAGTQKYFQGNSNFTFDPYTDILDLTGTLRVKGEIQATQLHTSYVTSSVLFEEGSTRFGNSSDDTHDFVGMITASMGITSSLGISASYFLGDGSALTGISAGSSLGNPGYVNAASSSVPFWGRVDVDSEYGLTGSGRFNFYSGSNSLQVTGNIRATDLYVTQQIFHEGDENTSIYFATPSFPATTDTISFETAGALRLSMSDTSLIVNSPKADYDFIVRTDNRNDTFNVDAGSDNVGIRCFPSGTIQALTVSGSTLFGSASANSHEFIGSIYAEQDIVHLADTNTKITFTDDQIDFAAGGVTLLTLDEAGQDIVTVGDGSDVDFQVKTLNQNHTLFIEGSSDKVSVGYSTPTQALLSVSGSSQFGRPEGHSDEHWFSGSVFVTDDIHVEDKIYGFNDTNTYIDFNTDDQLEIAAGGVSKLILVESGEDYLQLGGGPGSTAAVDVRMGGMGYDNTLWVDGESHNVGIRCAPSGTIQALTVSGSTLFGSASANTHQFIGSVSVTQDISFGGNLHNASDDDTYLDFQDDQIRFYAGNVQFADYHEVAVGQDTTIFNGTGADIDFLVKSDGATGAGAGTNLTHTIFVEGSSAKVGIAESSPETQLDISGSLRFGRKLDTYHMVTGSLELTGNIGLNTTASSYSLALPNADSLMGRGIAYAWSTYSSARYKDNVFTMQDPLETAKKLRGVEFTWKESGHRDFGFIAEEVGKVLPQLVSYEADGITAIGMDYAKITSLLVECVKSQQMQIEIQEKRIKQLEKKPST